MHVQEKQAFFGPSNESLNTLFDSANAA